MRAAFGGGAGYVLLLFFMAAVCGCGPHSSPSPAPPELGAGGAASDTLAPGVVHRAISTGPDAGVDLIDVDTARAHAKLFILTANLHTAHGRTYGSAFTPDDWRAKTHALAVVNGGYFGELDADGRTEIMGLLVQRGKVVHAATVPHAALLLDAQGHPQIAWASSRKGRVVLLGASLGSSAGVVRPVVSAVGCGPMLVWNGKVHVTDKEERLVSPGARARTFVATDSTGRHVVFGMASGAEYTSLARFVVQYFTRCDHTTAGRAFCLDGGSSTQLTYKLPNGSVRSPRQTGATVPDALVLLSR